MKPYIIGLDVDDVLANLFDEWIRRYSARYNDNVTAQDVRDWAISNYCTKCTKDELFAILGEPDIYEFVAPVSGALEFVQWLRAQKHADGTPKYRVVFVTACVSFESAAWKFTWLLKQGFFGDTTDTWDTRRKLMKDYFPACDKSLVMVNALVDDNLDNVRTCHGYGVLFHRPHNADHPTPLDCDRAHNFNEVKAYLELFFY